jgi:hypothetical protein
MVGPVSLTTTPVPFRKKRARHERHLFQPNDRRASACGTATVVSLRLRSCRLSASAPLSRSPNRRPKQNRQGSRVSMAMLKVKGVNITKPGTTVRLTPPRR